MRCVIDPGHGGTDPGAVGCVGKEANVALENAFELRRRMQALGHSITMTRVNDTFIPLKDRCQIANDKHADYFISLHCNADADDDGPGQPEASGVEVWYYAPSEKSKKLASAVVNEMHNAYPAITRCKIKATETLYVLKRTHIPSILIELGFIDSHLDLDRLTKVDQVQTFQSVIARALSAFALPSK